MFYILSMFANTTCYKYLKAKIILVVVQWDSDWNFMQQPLQNILQQVHAMQACHGVCEGSII